MITAKITGAAEDSMIPEDPHAVDADVFLFGALLGSVTLTVVDEGGELSSFGELDMWAGPSICRVLRAAPTEVREKLTRAIENAVREQADATVLSRVTFIG